MKQKSVMHNFAVNPDVKLPRSVFNMPFGHKTTGDAGWLIPIFWQMVLPGDTLTCNPSVFARMATPLFPLMDNAYIDLHHFFVPTRQYWDNYRKFHGEQANPGDSISYSIPKMSGGVNSNAAGDLTTTVGRTQVLMNYLGIPNGIDSSDVDINADCFRSYNHIVNEWYRDQNLINSLTFDTGDAASADTNYLLQRRGKRIDYFTQALPSPQRGSAVTLPLGTTAPVISDGTNPTFTDQTTTFGLSTTAAAGLNTDTAITGGPNNDVDFVNSGLSADLTSATSATINDIREAQQVQKLLERDARSGTRLPEILRSHYGVTNFYDASYRPEFLGGGSMPIIVRQVEQQGVTTNGSQLGVGDLAGYGTAVSTGNGFTKSFVEHGVVMTMLSIRADLTYQYGLNRFFSHQTRYDVAYPILAHLGEQAILSKELFVDGTANDEDVFGYIPRYDEYRYNISRISGLFQSALGGGSLDAWHLSQEFSTRPTLGQTFIEEDPPFDRVIAVPSEPHFIIDYYADIKCARVLPTYGIPGAGGTL